VAQSRPPEGTTVRDVADIPPHSHDHIVNTFAELGKNTLGPNHTPKTYEGLHRDFLKEKDEIIKARPSADDLAGHINVAAGEFQRKLAATLGPNDYEKLTGSKAGDIVHIVDPRLVSRP
jgi:hypothetical protein